MRAGPPPTDDRRVRRLPLLARLAALRQDPRRAARVPAAGGPTFAAAHRVADGVHGRAAVVRLLAQPALAASLAEADGHVVRVTDGADGRPALRVEAAHFARRQRDLGPRTIAGGQGGA